MIVDPANPVADRQVAAASLRTFMRLPVAQRSSVILMDVLGYSLQEIGDVLDTSVAAVKAALHRGRARLRELADEPDDRPQPLMSEAQRSLLRSYVDRFNARDFDALRDMLADEVRLDRCRADQAATAATRSAPTSTTTLTAVTGVSRWAWSTDASAALACDPDDRIGKAVVLRPARMGGRSAADDPRFPLCPLCRRRRRVHPARLKPPLTSARVTVSGDATKEVGNAAIRPQQRGDRAAYPA